MATETKKVYLGDGLYADFDGYHFVLTTENGITTSNTIYLEPEILNNFLKYVEWKISKI
jgi:hypothetical protein